MVRGQGARRDSPSSGGRGQDGVCVCVQNRLKTAHCHAQTPSPLPPPLLAGRSHARRLGGPNYPVALAARVYHRFKAPNWKVPDGSSTVLAAAPPGHGPGNGVADASRSRKPSAGGEQRARGVHRRHPTGAAGCDSAAVPVITVTNMLRSELMQPFY